MITYVKGNLFESPAQVLVNTVNTVGVMGKGIALEFKRIWPEMFHEYRSMCEEKRLDVGTLHLYKAQHKWILNFPTKKHWRQPSKLEYIENGLRRFAQGYTDASIRSIAFPPLGCGNGQLDFRTQVRPLMEEHLGRLPISIFVYPEKPAKALPEHMDAKGIRAWLRSEPESLPFSEVWDDIVGILGTRREFRTHTKGTPYYAWSETQPPRIRIQTCGSSSRKYPIEYEDLLEFWQRLRQHGFAFRAIAPEHHRVSYLLPIFAALDYVREVSVSPTAAGLAKQASVALQIVPPAKTADVAGELFETRVG